MSTPLLALDCPRCGAQLGAPTEGGSYICTHCGENSRAKVEVQVQHVVGPQKFNVVATQKEIDERKQTFERSLAKDLVVRQERATAEQSDARTRTIVRVVLALVVVGMVIVAVLAVAGVVVFPGKGR